MTQSELEKIIEIITIHTDHDGGKCDTGKDMEWACRSDCMKDAVARLRTFFGQ